MNDSRNDHDDEKLPDPPELREGMYEVVRPDADFLPDPPENREAPEDTD